MSRRPRGLTAALAVAGSLALTSTAVAGQAPPLPTAANGAAVERLAGGLATPTSFAFAGDTVFAGIGPAERGHPPTGLMTVANGSAKKVPGTAPVVFGLAWHNDRLFVSSGDKITSYRGWNGTRFTGSRIVRRANSQLEGFNGLAFGPDGRLYTGVGLNPKFDHSKNPARYANTVVSMRATGADLKIVARGLRQPFQLTFPAGATSPYVTDLAQDSGDDPARPGRRRQAGLELRVPVLRPRHGEPMRLASPSRSSSCRSTPPRWGSARSGRRSTSRCSRACRRRSRSSSRCRSRAGRRRPLVSGFVAPVVALNTNANYVYFGDLTGSLYRVAVAA